MSAHFAGQHSAGQYSALQPQPLPGPVETTHETCWCNNRSGNCGIGIGSADVRAEEKKSRPIDPGTPELVLHYDFYGVEGDQVSDASGQKHGGKLIGGQIVPGSSQAGR